MELIKKLIEKHLQPILEPLFTFVWQSAFFWRSVVIIFLALLLIPRIQQKIKIFFVDPTKHNHDKALFLKADALMDERTFIRAIEEIGATQSYRASFLSAAENFKLLFDEVTNQFFHEKVKKTNSEFCRQLKKLINYLAINFGPADRAQDWDNMRFISNIKYRGYDNAKLGEHEKFTDELNAILDVTQESYINYRRAVKENLIL